MISLAFQIVRIEMMMMAIFKMLRTRKIAHKLDFWSLVNPKICAGPALRGSCAARNIQYFGGATRLFVMICMGNTYLIWLVETVP